MACTVLETLTDCELFTIDVVFRQIYNAKTTISRSPAAAINNFLPIF